MTHEQRMYTDEQLRMIFKNCNRTSILKIHNIEYCHFDDDINYDFYIVTTDNGVYKYQYAEKQRRKTAMTGLTRMFYDRIVKIK